MHFQSSMLSLGMLSLLLTWVLLPLARADYWVFNEPLASTTWTNGQTNLIQWTKSLDDNITEFDIELQRMSTSALSYIAQQVPASLGALNVYIDNLTPADDYYLMFGNATHGVLYVSSSAFTISDSTNSSSPSPISSAPTVSVTRAPNPTIYFATTFASFATRAWTGLDERRMQIIMGVVGVLAGILGGAWAVL